MIYLFDTNAIADLMNDHPAMVAQVRAHQREDVLGLCQPVDYEVWRGLRWRTAAGQLQLYINRIRPQFEWIPLIDEDWRQAAQFWAETRRAGKQLSDVDLLLAALAYRLNAVIVTNDDDFGALTVRHENWRHLSNTSE
ncbi:MAG: PIN domain-containing protein [Chloroflexi bacterium]|nr:PIN domain-containing protein [Chloroflexota bacterium]